MSTTQALPVRERLSLNVIATLEGVAEAAGFNVTLDVERYNPKGNTPADLKAIVSDGADRLAESEDTPEQHTAKWALFEVLVYVFESEASDVKFDTRCHVAEADVERAVMENDAMGGLAEETRMLDPLIYEPPDGPGGILVRFECRYVHLIRNPYSRHGE